MFLLLKMGRIDRAKFINGSQNCADHDCNYNLYLKDSKIYCFFARLFFVLVWFCI